MLASAASRTFTNTPPTARCRPATPPNARQALTLELARQDNTTTRQIIRYLANTQGRRVIVGCAKTIADNNEARPIGGTANGFNLLFPYAPAALIDLVELMILKSGRWAYCH